MEFNSLTLEELEEVEREGCSEGDRRECGRRWNGERERGSRGYKMEYREWCARSNYRMSVR